VGIVSWSNLFVTLTCKMTARNFEICCQKRVVC
jgi:hypothetical protein